MHNAGDEVDGRATDFIPFTAIGPHWLPIATRTGDGPWLWRLSYDDIVALALARKAGRIATIERHDGTLWVLLARWPSVVAVKLANLDHGQRADLVSDRPANLPLLQTVTPVTPVTQSRAADMLNVSERSVKAARAVREHAVPTTDEYAQETQRTLRGVRRLLEEAESGIGRPIRLTQRLRAIQRRHQKLAERESARP